MRKSGAATEDDGWVMSYVYGPVRDLGDVVILEWRRHAPRMAPPMRRWIGARECELTLFGEDDEVAAGEHDLAITVTPAL